MVGIVESFQCCCAVETVGNLFSIVSTAFPPLPRKVSRTETSFVLSLNGSGPPKLGVISFCYGRYYAITARNRVSPCTHCTKKNIFLCAIYHLYFLFKYAIIYIVIKQTLFGENTCSNCYGVEIIRSYVIRPYPWEEKIMNEKVILEVHTTPFTTHYTVKRTDGLLECRTVHRCPKCGKAQLIIWGDEKSMYWTDIIFGFRKVKGVLHVQSSCRSCRCYPRSASNGGSNNG